MSESAVAESGDKSPRHESREGRNIFGRIALFVRQVIAELKLVVTPSREETVRYIWVVVGFVAVVMLLVFAMDFLFSAAAVRVFGD